MATPVSTSELTLNVLLRKLSILCLLLSIVSLSYSQRPGNNTTVQNNLPKTGVIKWNNNHIDIGVVPRHVPVIVNFNFINAGTADIEIIGATCNVPGVSINSSKGMVPPGFTGFVSVAFTPAYNGPIQMSVKLLTTLGTDVLTVSGYVMKSSSN